MDIKRIITIVIGLPLVILLLVFGNEYVVDVAVCITAIISLYEYFRAFKEKENGRFLHIIAYASTIIIAFLHIIPIEYLYRIIAAIIPISVIVLFSQIIMTDMKYTIKDASISLYGICYIVISLLFFALIRETPNGRINIWYMLFAAWGTDTFAYLVGIAIGKHKFSKISPKKSIEGCVGGAVGAIICVLLYTLICNTYFGTNYNYLLIGIIGLVLSLVGQLGDFAASSIKRYVEIKDFGQIFPGHGGMLDRIDSLIFVAPVAYFLLTLI